jgi:hypothetical protein
MRNYQVRNKFFFASPALFRNWPYNDRRAIGMKLSDFWGSKDTTYRFIVGGDLYEIEAEKAKILGRKYQMGFGSLPNIIPLAEFKRLHKRDDRVSEQQLPERPTMLTLWNNYENTITCNN